jgi:hypothetical protein
MQVDFLQGVLDIIFNKEDAVFILTLVEQLGFKVNILVVLAIQVLHQEEEQCLEQVLVETAMDTEELLV